MITLNIFGSLIKNLLINKIYRVKIEALAKFLLY